jgi:hypothetical protein
MMFVFTLQHPISLLGCIGPFLMCTPWLDLSDGVVSTPNRDSMQNLFPREVDVSIESHKPFGVSSFRIRVLDV